ncbi:hypothetical protein ACUOA5_14870, partial [Escherichia coli]
VCPVMAPIRCSGTPARSRQVINIPFYSQAFSRLRRSVLPIATDRQCFHSLRGMFITCLDRAGVPEQRIGAITGHTEQRAKTEAFRTYSQGASIPELAEYVELVKYELNIDFKA